MFTNPSSFKVQSIFRSKQGLPAGKGSWLCSKRPGGMGGPQAFGVPGKHNQTAGVIACESSNQSSWKNNYHGCLATWGWANRCHRFPDRCHRFPERCLAPKCVACGQGLALCCFNAAVWSDRPANKIRIHQWLTIIINDPSSLTAICTTTPFCCCCRALPVETLNCQQLTLLNPQKCSAAGPAQAHPSAQTAGNSPKRASPLPSGRPLTHLTAWDILSERLDSKPGPSNPAVPNEQRKKNPY